MKDSEPDLNLIYPRGMQWRIVEVKPVVVPCVEVSPALSVMNIQIVPDNVNGSVDLGGQILHECFQIIARSGGADVAKHLPGGHDESSY